MGNAESQEINSTWSGYMQWDAHMRTKAMADKLNTERVITNLFDHIEVQTNVTVQILTNTKTGDQSIGWTRDDGLISVWVENAHVVGGG